MTHDMHDSECWIFWKIGLMYCDGFAPIRKCNYGRYDSDYSHQSVEGGTRLHCTDTQIDSFTNPNLRIHEPERKEETFA